MPAPLPKKELEILRDRLKVTHQLSTVNWV